MQLINAPNEITFPSIEIAIENHRLNRYFRGGARDSKAAFSLYRWNCALCESFLVPLHFSEVLCRNALHRALIRRAGDNWYSDRTFRLILDEDFLAQLDNACANEAFQHRQFMTAHHVMAELTFGFWEHLTTKRFERFLWAKGIREAFPGAPRDKTFEHLHDLIESVRRWRNRIAHHKAIFDKKPEKKHADAMELIKWVCGDTENWISSVSQFHQAMALKPT